MDRFAIFLDAGYFFAAGANAIAGQTVSRKQISLKDASKAIQELSVAASKQVQGLPHLRTYWYDAMPGARPSLEQSTIAMLPHVKFRFGVLNSAGEQKGVDSLIVTDLIELARNKAIADAVIVSGDEDLRVAVQLAQSFGVRVHVLAAGDPNTNVSPTLQMEADSVASLDKAWFSQHLTITKPAAAVPLSQVLVLGASGKVSAPVGGANALDGAAAKVCAELLAAASKPQITGLQAHFDTNSMIPPEFDRRLIAKTAAEMGGQTLSGADMRHVRGIFVKSVRALPRT